MSNFDQENSNTNKFHERYANYTDAQILEILKNQKDYQENARNAAVKIAIERQLIHSEQDLLSPEFQNSRSTKPRLFPEINTAYHHQKLVDSIFRFLYVLSFLPIVYGVLKYFERIIDQTIWGICIGVIWLLLVFLLKRIQKPIVLVPLFGILILLGVLSSFKIVANHPIRILDVVILILGMILPAYLLIYLKKLIQNKPENNE